MSFVALTGGLPGTQKLWEGVRFLSQAVIGIRAKEGWDENHSEGDEDTELSMLD